MNNTHIQKYTDRIYKGNTNFVKQNYYLIQKFAKKENNNFANNSDITEFLNEKVRSIFSFFRNIIKNASAEKK